VRDKEVLLYNINLLTQENQEKRLFLLRKLFEMSLGVPCLVAVHLFEEETKWYEHDIYETARYLSEEGLLRIEDDEGSGRPPHGPYLCLTHKGIVEVEQSITNPTKATPHFAATVMHNYNASVGAVQTAPYSTAHALQNLGVEFPKAFKYTEDLRHKISLLPPEVQESVTQLVEGLEDEFRLSQPRKARVRAFLKELNGLTGKISVRKSLASLAKQYDIQL